MSTARRVEDASRLQSRAALCVDSFDIKSDESSA